MKKSFTLKGLFLVYLTLICSLSQALAQESSLENAAYRGGQGDGYAMAEISIHSRPTAVSQAPENHLKLYPNPLKQGDVLMLQLPPALPVNHIRLIDAQGNLLFEKSQDAWPANENSIRIATQRWPAGIYFLQLQSTASTITKKIILL